jgi:hypothetical protein
MSARSFRFLASFLAFAGLAQSAPFLRAQKAGIFDGQQDVGAVLHAGSATFDTARNTYTVTGSGENMWFAEDDLLQTSTSSAPRGIPTARAC